MTNEKTDNTDEPSKAELHDRVQQLESTVEKLMPSRRDALRMGAAGLAGAAGLGAASQSADASTGSAGDIGDPNNRPDLFADQVDTKTIDFGSPGNREIIQTGGVSVVSGEYVVGTSQVDILNNARNYFGVVKGTEQGTANIFVDVLTAVSPGGSSPTVINSKEFGPPDSRSYGNLSAGSTPLSMSASTYDVEAIAFTFNL